jgi:hypothetical protein
MLSYVDARPHEMLKDLIEDVEEAFRILEEDKENQYLRRSAVKAVF